MRIQDIIEKKKNKLELTNEEIKFFVEGFSKGIIPDYQISPLLMAICLNDMTSKETSYLTKHMLDSGKIMNLSSIKGVKVDKHSTGGIGDKVSIALSPLVAACGGVVAKMSGRGLGQTGGTIDKLESINGFKVELSEKDFINQVKKIGVAIIAQSSELVLADKKIYALRDTTATVESIPLIASSIMSKKIATGADAILLDVKVGDGAFMKNSKQAENLARAMISIGKHFKKQVIAHLTDMNEPLGNTVGNAIEIIEAIDTLKGKGPADFQELILDSASLMLVMGKVHKTYDSALKAVKKAISDGSALNKFYEWVGAQGGDVNQAKNYDLLFNPKYKVDIKSDSSGFLKIKSSSQVGIISMLLGAGRMKKEDNLDFHAGIFLNKKSGNQVNKGEVIATLYSSNPIPSDIVKKYKDNTTISKEKVKRNKLIIKLIK
jgi:pyrimidine-nucleoside phosphorylase